MGVAHGDGFILPGECHWFVLDLAVAAARLKAGATARGHAAISYDPTYAFAPAEVGQRVNVCHDGLIAQVRSDPDGLVVRVWLPGSPC